MCPCWLWGGAVCRGAGGRKKETLRVHEVDGGLQPSSLARMINSRGRYITRCRGQHGAGVHTGRQGVSNGSPPHLSLLQKMCSRVAIRNTMVGRHCEPLSSPPPSTACACLLLFTLQSEEPREAWDAPLRVAQLRDLVAADVAAGKTSG